MEAQDRLLVESMAPLSSNKQKQESPERHILRKKEGLLAYCCPTTSLRLAAQAYLLIADPLPYLLTSLLAQHLLSASFPSKGL